MRLDKYLSHALNVTRKGSRQIIKNKQVKINDNIITDAGYFINEEIDVVKYLEEEVTYREFVYLMLNKPSGYVSATIDNIHPTVIDLIDEKYKGYNLFPVGRLDIDTEGLLLITNNGKLNHYLTSPNHNVYKTYYAKVKGEVNSDDEKKFKDGMWLVDGKDEEYFTLPATLEIIKSGEFSEVFVTISEGKFHQVKKMFHHVGKEVIYLKRVMMKNISLDGNLDLGKFRELTKEEIKNLKSGFNL